MPEIDRVFALGAKLFGEAVHDTDGSVSQPMHMWSAKVNGWLLMAHGSLFLVYDQQGGQRGAGKFDSTNWLMLMEQRHFGGGEIQFREMLSAEPLTAPHGGYHELFQTGETYKGVPLVDLQHPHDVFGELAALYSLPLSQRLSWEVYAGPAGEPAFGAVTYLHRGSASELPSTPLGHHQQDSTHISYGVITSGFASATGNQGALKLEGSAFNGREPDEDRVDLDFAPLDSFSGRVSFDPSAHWSTQYSYAHLVQPEASEPGNIDRQTASVSYDHSLASLAGNLSATLLWGRNHKIISDTRQNSYLFESVMNFAKKNYAFTRLELVDKDELFSNLPAPPSPALARSFRIAAYSFGGVRDLVHNSHGQIGLGADLTFYSMPDALTAFYGNHPVSLQVFLRFRPGLALRRLSRLVKWTPSVGPAAEPERMPSALNKRTDRALRDHVGRSMHCEVDEIFGDR